MHILKTNCIRLKIRYNRIKKHIQRQRNSKSNLG